MVTEIFRFGTWPNSNISRGNYSLIFNLLTNSKSIGSQCHVVPATVVNGSSCCTLFLPTSLSESQLPFLGLLCTFPVTNIWAVCVVWIHWFITGARAHKSISSRITRQSHYCVLCVVLGKNLLQLAWQQGYVPKKAWFQPVPASAVDWLWENWSMIKAWPQCKPK